MAYETWQNIEGKKVPSTSGFSEKIFDYLKKSSKVLDLGCGYGRLSSVLFSKGFQVYGIDVNENAIKEAQANPKLKDINFSVQDATNTNFKNNFFEGIISQAVLACMPVELRIKCLKECCRILKLGGILQIAEFGQTNDKEDYLENMKITGEYGTVVVKNPDGSERFRSHNFTKEELERLFAEAGLRVMHYENLDFITVKGNKHPGHIFLCKKLD